jgi:hypothetical protein
VQTGSSVTLATGHRARGADEPARDWADRALDVAREIGSLSHLRTASALGMLAREELGEPGSAERYLDVLDSPPLVGVEALACQVICEALIAIGDLKRAEQCAERSLQNSGGRLRELVCTIALGDVLARLGPGRWSEAERLLDRAHGLGQALGSRSALAAISLARAELASASGDGDEAIRHAEVARAAYRALGFVRYEGRAERLLADLTAATQQTA